jgi:hypothetical protein
MHCCKGMVRLTTSLVVLCAALLWTRAFSAGALNYDTAWTFVYDGGKRKTGDPISDNFRDIKVLPNGEAVAVGETRDSNFVQYALVVKFSAGGKVLARQLHGSKQGTGAGSLVIMSTGDIVIGGYRYTQPWLLRLDSELNVKSSTWVYDTVGNKDILAQSAMINSVIEVAEGGVVAAAGDAFPNNRGQTLRNYAAFLEFDSSGTRKRASQWKDPTGYEIAGWSIAKRESGGYMLGGKQAVLALDVGGTGSFMDYKFSLPGVGTVVNNVSRVRSLRSGKTLVAGQSYEEDCWTKFSRLSYDAWWSPLSGTGDDEARYVAGVSGANDVIYDATQLVDGNLVFVGTKRSVDQIGGVWAVVTDSTGKTVLWEKQVRIPYLSDKGESATPWAVAATPDSGFTVAGIDVVQDSLGAENAFAAHFRPKASSTVLLRNPAGAVGRVRPGELAISLDFPQAGAASLKVFDSKGRLVAERREEIAHPGKSAIAIDISRLNAGIHFWKINAPGLIQSGTTLF